MPPAHRTSSVLADARRVLRIEAQAVARLGSRIGPVFGRIVELIFRCPGRVVVTGLGKSGLIAQKIAATLASTGTPAIFVHAAEAVHGNLGMLTAQDIVLAISNSGETEEIIRLVPHIKRLGMPMIAMTGRPQSALGGYADFIMDVSVREEACPFGLAPTASTTAVLAMGDALAVALLNRRKFQPKDFARLHPGGELGKSLIKVHTIMHTGRRIPVIARHASVEKAVAEMTRKRFGCVGIVDGRGILAGIFTDGDLRRLVGKTRDLARVSIGQVMTPRPIVIHEDDLAVKAMRLMQDKRIFVILVTDARRRLTGILHFLDLLDAGLA